MNHKDRKLMGVLSASLIFESSLKVSLTFKGDKDITKKCIEELRCQKKRFTVFQVLV